MHIACDIDDVLANFNEVFLAWHNYTYSTSIQLEDVHAYNIADMLGISTHECWRRYEAFYVSPDFALLAPLPFAEQTILKLSQSHRFSAITGRPVAIEEATRSWLDQYFLHVFSKITSIGRIDESGYECLHTKFQICQATQVDVIIEDAPSTALECAFGGIDVLLFDRPWNRSIDIPTHVTRVFSWEEIASIIPVHAGSIAR